MPRYYVTAKLETTKRRHAFNGSELALCGTAHLANCYGEEELDTKSRWRKKKFKENDLNYCQQCHRALVRRGAL